MIRHWNRLPKEQVETQSVEAFERCVCGCGTKGDGSEMGLGRSD